VPSEMTDVYTSWPRFLNFSPPEDALANFPGVSIHMSHVIKIPLTFGADPESTSCVTYQLVGRSVFHKSHYTTDILIPYEGEMQTYHYNDMRIPKNK